MNERIILLDRILLRGLCRSCSLSFPRCGKKFKGLAAFHLKVLLGQRADCGIKVFYFGEFLRVELLEGVPLGLQ